MKTTAEDRVQRAWEKLTLGPGWEDRLSLLMVKEIESAVAEALAGIDEKGVGRGPAAAQQVASEMLNEDGYIDALHLGC